MLAPAFIATAHTGSNDTGAASARVINGVLQVRGPDALALPAARQAPDLAAIQVELPALQLPPDHVARLADRMADLNGDGVVDPLDLAFVAAAIGPCPDDSSCAADFNRDGVVDDQDMFEVSARLGQTVSRNNQMQKLEVGYVQNAPPDLLAGVPWNPVREDCLVAAVELHSNRAVGLRVQFANLSAAYEVRIYDPAGTAVLGPYQAPSRSEDGTWWSPTIYGSTIGIEITSTGEKSADALALPVISNIAYLYDGCECATGPGTPMLCHLDVTCYKGWADEARAVTQISFISSGGCFNCTGALLNRGPNDFVPLFMTANHCISLSAEADSVEVRWLYQTDVCDASGSIPGWDEVPINLGAQILKRHSGTDWTLLGLYDPPALANPYWLGSSAADWTVGGDATGIHHPRGSYKRISFGEIVGSTDDNTFCDGNGQNCWEADVWDILCDEGDGVSEPGSSGSPILDGLRRVRGTLSGGAPSQCNDDNTRLYGRLDLAWANLQYFLSDSAIPAEHVYVDGGVPGDPGNNGNLERGTSSLPFNSVREATYCVRDGDTLTIAPDSYNQAMTIRRPMTITRWGSSGVVTIGQ